MEEILWRAATSKLQHEYDYPCAEHSYPVSDPPQRALSACLERVSPPAGFSRACSVEFHPDGQSYPPYRPVWHPSRYRRFNLRHYRDSDAAYLNKPARDDRY